MRARHGSAVRESWLRIPCGMESRMSISSTLPSVQPVHGEWAQRITAAWQKTVEGVIETGTLLVQAKRWMSPNEFTDMIEHSYRSRGTPHSA